ncbi:MAG: branched-chain amino acid ABC transporter permease [Clostridiales Family XIII bacterium]|jgi:branched-chain amino acid transport system permease protein|nr:branched-chain amino acid ABC transporter permease [Clostridiales Family XIII bacterium]
MELIKTAFFGSTKSKVQLIGVIAALVILFLSPQFLNTYMPNFLAKLIAYVVLSLSWTIFSGKTGYISLASAAFYGLGMYIEALFGMNIPLPVVMVFAAAVAFAVAFGVGVVTLRLRGVYFTIFTFGLALFLQKSILWIEVKFFHTKGRMVLAYSNEAVFYCVLVVFAILIFVVILMNKSRFGLALDCIGQNEDSAQHIGVNTTMTKVLAFAISAAPAGAVGAAIGTSIGYVDPDIAFNMLLSFLPVLMAIFGGMRSMYGPIVGAVIFFVLQDYLMREYANLYMIIFGAVMVVVILFMPKGIFGLVDKAIAKRQRNFDGEVIGDVK